MTTKTSGAIAPAESSTRDLLDTVADYYPNLSDAQKQGLRKWSTFEDFISLPFIPKTDAAEYGDAFLFTILKVGERVSLKPGSQDEAQEQHILLVRVDTDAQLVLARGNATRDFHKGDRALVGYPKGPFLRDNAVKLIHNILEENGELPGMYLEQLESKDPALNGPIVLRCIFSGSEIIGTEPSPESLTA